MLGLAVGEHLFRRFPRADIGRLTKVHGQAVSGRACAEVARELGLPAMLAEAAPETQEGGIDPDSLLASERAMASVCEAVIGACYLHYGSRRRPRRRSRRSPTRSSSRSRRCSTSSRRSRSSLRAEGARVTYEVTREAGPPHDRRFEVAARSIPR